MVNTNHWWQNWPKTHAYVAEKMFFPKSVDEIATSIQAAEANRRPLRAVGGGWSFSDAALPGDVTTNRPNVYAVEALSEVVPLAESFPSDKSQASIATIADAVPIFDGPGSMVMVTSHSSVDEKWTYKGMGVWEETTVYRLGGRGQGQTIIHSYATQPHFLEWLARKGLRPIRDPKGLSIKDADTAGSLVMYDLMNDAAAQPLQDWFYNGHGVWSVGVSGNRVPPDSVRGNWDTLLHEFRLRPHGMNLSPRAAYPGDSLFLLLSKHPPAPAPVEAVYLVNTRSLVSSLQQRLPSILSDHAMDVTSDAPTTGVPRRHFFHVEGGITIAELGSLLAHQSPRLTLQAISGSPGATLAGALSTATHGAEFNWPLLVDRVKAMHLVGPGGLQWWIEGNESIADPQKLRAAYPGITLDQIITGQNAVSGIVPQDWLNAVIVSMGSMGVLYSVVLEVVPLFGVHEIVVQKTWRNIGFLGIAGKDLPTLLRDPDPAISQNISTRLVKMMQNGNMNGTGIPQVDAHERQINQYADLAINPNRRVDGDLDCWIGNREVTEQVPLEPQPSTTNETVDMIKGITVAFSSEDLSNKLKNIYGFGSWLDIIGNALFYSTARVKINNLAQSSDFIDVALDTFLTPLAAGHPDGPEMVQTLLSGILSGLLNTANSKRRSDKTGVSVGALGFPGSGVMGTGIEIALSPADAFGFLQTEILDKIDSKKPFFGYVSIRLCSKTETLMGMQQFGDEAHPCSVMIEVVGYGTEDSRNFIQQLQKRTVDRILSGLDAMLHWGLENEQLTDKHLHSIKALQKPTRSGMSKLSTFKAVRSLVHVAAPAAYRVFDNGFTKRLGLSWLNGLQFCDDNKNVIHIWNPIAFLGQPGSHLVANARYYLKDLYLLNPFKHAVQVKDVQITSSKDADAPVFVAHPRQFSIGPGQIYSVMIEYTGAQAGQLTGIVEVECDDPIDPIVRIPLSASVIANRHAELRITPASLDFGKTLVGTEVFRNLTITNIGFYSATFVNITVSPSGPFGVFPSYPAASLPGGLAPGNSVVIRVLYQPMARGEAHAALVIDMQSRTDVETQYSRHDEIPLAGIAHMPTIFLAAGPIRRVHELGGPGLLPARDRELMVLDFGIADPATAVAASFWIRNVGDTPLTVQGVVIINQGSFGVTDITIFPATLPPDGEMEVPCNFLASPVPGSMVGGEFQVVSDDPLRSSAVLIVKGGAAGPHLSEPSELLDLGVVPPAPASATITFRSDGTLPVTVRKLTLTTGINFSVSYGHPLPAQLAPGMTVTVTVTLTATLRGLFQDQLFMVHDGNHNNSSQVLLRGRRT